MVRPRSLAWAVPGAAAAAFAYASLYEVNAYTLRRVTVPVLEPGAAPLRVLHVSDLHLRPGQRRKRDWVRSLAALKPDLVVNTGDNLADLNAAPAVLDAFDELLDVPGVFVFGSNDYFSPVFKNPLAYLFGGTGVASGGDWKREPDLPYERLRAGFTARGWIDLNNRHADLMADGRKLAFVGVDDPHLDYDHLDDLPADPTAELAIGVTHAPYQRVLDHWTRAGYRLILAGHTHGGQVCVPGYGALVSNCDLDPRNAKGLNQHQVLGYRPTWVHVSAGLGTSPYAPIRFACRPEATLLTLTG